jgi:hypothetical protein
MVIVGMITYPPEQAKEVAKRFGQAPPLPSYITLKGPYINSELGVGTKVIAIYEFDQAKTREAMEYVSDRYAKYIGVPGLTYSHPVWLEVGEALKLIGLG